MSKICTYVLRAIFCLTVIVVSIGPLLAQEPAKPYEFTEQGHAVIQRLPPEFAKIELVSFREGRALHLKVKSPPGKSGSRYDMAVYVPAEMALVVHGTSHRIVARKRVAPLTITTTSGPIEATSQGRLDLSTDSGAIRASQLVERWSGSSQIQSKSGRIIVLVPLSGDVSIRAQTGGKLSTDFGLSIHTRDGGGSVAAEVSCSSRLPPAMKLRCCRGWR